MAKCRSTLELHIPPGGFSAVPFLEKSLGLYERRNGDDDDGDVTMDEFSNGSPAQNPSEMQKLRDGVFADIPVSSAECEAGWMEISAFVDEKHGTCWRPSARMRLNVWKRLMEGAILQGIDLEKQFLVGDLWESVLDDDDALEPPFPRELLEAVARRLCVADERPSLADEIKCKSLIFFFGIAVCIRFQLHLTSL